MLRITTSLVLLSVIALVAAVATIAFASSALKDGQRHDFCVVGGGPAGIQLGYFLHRHGLDYVILERNHHAGSFFDKYPRQRNLISINKVYTGTNDTEFNLRHDWNSLLTGDDDFFFPPPKKASDGDENTDTANTAAKDDDPFRKPLLFKHFSKQYYPKADTIPKYLDAFVEQLGGQLNIVYNADVARILREKSAAGEKKGDFVIMLSVVKNDKSDRLSVRCGVVVMASGKSVERKFQLKEGTHLVTQYTDAPQSPEEYTNKEVLILGAGNSAFELARSIESHAALVHIASRNPIQMAHQSHYVGDVRAVNLGFLDRYQLKSMDVLMTLSTPDIRHGRLYFDKESQRIMLRQSAADPREETLSDSEKRAARAMAKEQLEMEKAEDAAAAKEVEMNEDEMRSIAGGNLVGGKGGTLMDGNQVDEHVRREMQESKQGGGGGGGDSASDRALMAEASQELFPSRRGYHRVIACLGFKWNSTPFASDAAVAGALPSSSALAAQQGSASSSSSSKYEAVQPFSDAGDSFLEIASNYESVNVPDLFVAGALAHFRDFKRSAGGFIHGFRYTARVLAALLRERYAASSSKAVRAVTSHAEPEYPYVSLWSRWEVLERIMFRLKNVSSLYQMQSQLCDVVLIQDGDATDGSGAKKDGSSSSSKRTGNSGGVVFNDKTAPYRYYQDLPIDLVKSRAAATLGIRAMQKATLHFVTLSLEFGKDFQGVGTLHHQAQKETYKRRAEKMLWDHNNAAADPDFRLYLHRNGGNSTPIERITEKITAAELMRREEEAKFRRGGGSPPNLGSARRDPRGEPGSGTTGAIDGSAGGYTPVSPQKSTLLHPLEMPPQMLPPQDGKPARLDRFLFLHPVLREYKRMPEKQLQGDQQQQPLVKHQLLRELRLHEDVLNDFTGKHYHRTPTQKFLERSLPFA